MGLKKWMTDRAVAKMLDYGAVFAEQLADERVLGYTSGPHAASDGSDSNGEIVDLRLRGAGANRLIDGAIKKGMRMVANSKHMGGDEGSITYTVPKDIPNPMLVITDRSLILWDFGMYANDLPGRPRFSLPREQIRSIERTGKEKSGMALVKFTFADGSWCNYQLMDHELYADFFTAAAAIGR